MRVAAYRGMRADFRSGVFWHLFGPEVIPAIKYAPDGLKRSQGVVGPLRVHGCQERKNSMSKIINIIPVRVVWVVNVQDDRQPEIILSDLPEQSTISVTILAPSWDAALSLRDQAERMLPDRIRRETSA